MDMKVALVTKRIIYLHKHERLKIKISYFYISDLILSTCATQRDTTGDNNEILIDDIKVIEATTLLPKLDLEITTNVQVH